jgi:NAD(P)-dependent dehydrogenase (short-subunit alcohol dehydrogenase family)
MNVLITGGSSGIGECIAAYLHQKGHHVIGTSRNPSYVKGAPFEFLSLDITSPESVEALVHQLKERKFTIDVLINNAGIGVCGAFEETTMDLARKQMETNFWGAVRVTQAVLPLMREQRSGKVIFITSLAGLIGVPYQSFYAASKHALEGIAKSLRQEVMEFGISVSCVEPGFFKSNLHHNFDYAPAKIADYNDSRPNALNTFKESIATAPDPIEIAQTVEKIMQTKHPKMSYKVGNDGRWLPLLQFLNFGWFEMGTRKKFKLP